MKPVVGHGNTSLFRKFVSPLGPGSSSVSARVVLLCVLVSSILLGYSGELVVNCEPVVPAVFPNIDPHIVPDIESFTE
jgi:hypothetical protein